MYTFRAVFSAKATAIKMHSPIPLYIFRIIRVVLTLLDGRGLQNPCRVHKYLAVAQREIFVVHCAISVLSLVTLDISVKYEIYDSKIFTNNIAQYCEIYRSPLKKENRL